MLPTPHHDKLRALLKNAKLPESDRPAVVEAVSEYKKWIQALSTARLDTESAVVKMVSALNEYRLFLDVDLIFDSSENFLYRQKGQLKLDNTVLEEFLPHLVSAAFPQLGEDGFELGPRSCFSSLSFTSTLDRPELGGGPRVRTKDQDFAVSRRLAIRTSHGRDSASEQLCEAHLGYICAECKTNLDKTMFQEASATAHDLRTAIPGSKYYLLCEWLDMTPQSTAATDIGEVLILRKARRLGAQVRKHYGSAEGRQDHRASYLNYLRTNPFSVEVFRRLLDHIGAALKREALEEGSVLVKGFF